MYLFLNHEKNKRSRKLSALPNMLTFNFFERQSEVRATALAGSIVKRGRAVTNYFHCLLRIFSLLDLLKYSDEGHWK